jgi:beta-lactamase class A
MSSRIARRIGSGGLGLMAGGVVLLLLGGCTASEGPATPAPASAPAVTDTPTAPSDPAPAFTQLEQEFDARLGVYALDIGTGDEVAFRADERFAYASTAKALAAGLLLKSVSDAELDSEIEYTEAQLLPNSPITELNVATGMTLRSLAEASVRFSDNTAANLVLERLGGPAGFSEALRELNSAIPGDIRDTSTPRAFGIDLGALLTTDTLGAPQQSQLIDWMTGNATGAELIRAGLPGDWAVADKSGGGAYGTRNDIALVWPPTGSPIVLVIMSTRPEEQAEYDNALVARAAEVAVAALGH